jgi:bifunctional enzyme CysN/CysC
MTDAPTESAVDASAEARRDLIRRDVAAYLRQHERKDLLRFLTAGSVDDGKSTLIGRLLYDSKMIYEDQLAAVIRDSAVHGTTDTAFDPALLTDGLKAEREQGITIDVAYRYFSTDKRKFIIADTPGHEQYTRNMATGASTCDLAIILIDARYGVLEQTRRHSFIASLLGIRHFVICVNKMDLMDFSQEVFDRIRRDYEDFAAKLHVSDIYFLPISALRGDNVVEPSASMPWFKGAPLLAHLETVSISGDRNLVDMRFPVQYVLRPNLNFRGYAGNLASGVIRKGDEVMVLPSRRTSRVKSIVTFDGELQEAFAPMAIVVTLEDERDISRGDMLVHVRNVPHFGHEFEAVLVWMNEDALKLNHEYLIKCGTNLVPGFVNNVQYRFDINTLHRQEAPTLTVNAIGRVTVSVTRPIAFDAYARNRATGAFIVIDRVTNGTLAAGMILERDHSVQPRRAVSDKPVSAHVQTETSLVQPADRARLLRQKPATLWFTGLSGSGKSTIAKRVERLLFERGHAAFILDGDNVRQGLNRDLGFSSHDRTENIRRVAEVARLFNDAGLLAITSFISPYLADRQNARAIVGDEPFIEIFVKAPIEVCERRDPKGLYRKARSGQIAEFTGISAPYEPPTAPELTIETDVDDVEACARRVIAYLEEEGIIPAA